MPQDRSEPTAPSDQDFAETNAPVTRDPETGEQRYPEHVGGTERTASPPNEADDAEEQESGSGR